MPHGVCGKQHSIQYHGPEAIVAAGKEIGKMTSQMWNRALRLALPLAAGLVLAAAAAAIYGFLPPSTMGAAVLGNVCLLAIIVAVVVGFMAASEKGEDWISRRSQRGLQAAQSIEYRQVEPREVISARIRQRAEDPGRQVSPLDRYMPSTPSVRNQPLRRNPAPALEVRNPIPTSGRRRIGQ